MININLIAERRARKLREENILRKAAIGLVLLLVAVISLNFMAWFQMQSDRKDMLARQAERDDLLHQRAELVEIQRQIDRKGPVVDLLKQVRVSEGAWMTILADISRVIPHDVALANFHTQAGKDGVQLRLSGRALNEKKVAAFMNAINEQTLWAKTASLGPVSNERTGGDEGPQVKRFEIIVPVRGMLGGDL